MGANLKLLKQRLNEERSKITDRQFFTSRLLASHFEGIAAAYTRRYHYRQRVRVSLFWEPTDEHMAFTDNHTVTINAGNPWVTRTAGRKERYELICGLFAHEFGHVLYTDFLSGQTHVNSFAAGKWYPEPPELKMISDKHNEADLWKYVGQDPLQLKAVQYVAHELSNILEDGYVENRILVEFPGSLGYGLTKLRAKHFQEMLTVTQMKEKEGCDEQHIFATIEQLLLSYAKFGEVKYGDEPLTDERIQIVFGLLSDIDAMLAEHNGKYRLNATNLIMVRCWRYIKDFCEKCKEKLSENESSGIEGEMCKELASVIGKSESGSGTGIGVRIPASTADPSATASARERSHKDAAETQKEKNEEGASGDCEEAQEEKGQKGDSDDCEEMQEQERLPLLNTDSVSEPEGGVVEYNDAYANEQDKRAAADVEKILDAMAEKAACKSLESERLEELNEFAQSISYGNVHAGVCIRVNRLPEVGEERVEQFQTISAPLLEISKQLQRSLLKQLEDRRKGGKMKGLRFGRHLDGRSVYRDDGKTFYKKSLPNEMPQLAVALLLDESGSMYGDRVTYARAAAIILHDFCINLGIPVMVYGHSTDWDDNAVELYSYAEFDVYDGDDKYRIMDVSARSSNRDGAALRFVAERLAARTEEVKILILVSDGQPAADGYIGTAAEEDLRGIKHEYKRKGILFIAAAIGDDKENIERIYGESFLDITDLKELPAKLTAIVKRHIRV